MPPRPTTPADLLAKLIGEHIKRLRMAAGRRQGDVAQAAKQQGLNWTASTVGSIETGFRRLATHELLVLPLVLAEAGLAQHLRLEDVLPDSLVSEWMRTRYQLARQEALQRWDKTEKKMWLEEVGHEPDLPKMAGEDADGHPIYAETKRREPLPEIIDRWGDGEAELAAADALGVHPRRIALRSWRMWKRSLSQERDRRAAAQITAEMDAGAVRGHVTRSLLRELGFKKKSKSTRSRKGG